MHKMDDLRKAASPAMKKASEKRDKAVKVWKEKRDASRSVRKSLSAARALLGKVIWYDRNKVRQQIASLQNQYQKAQNEESKADRAVAQAERELLQTE